MEIFQRWYWRNNLFSKIYFKGFGKLVFCILHTFFLFLLKLDIKQCCPPFHIWFMSNTEKMNLSVYSYVRKCWNSVEQTFKSRAANFRSWYFGCCSPDKGSAWLLCLIISKWSLGTGFGLQVKHEACNLACRFRCREWYFE